MLIFNLIYFTSLVVNQVLNTPFKTELHPDAKSIFEQAQKSRQGQQTVSSRPNLLLLIIVNKVLLAHHHAHLLTYCPWLMLNYNSRAEFHNRNYIPKIFTVWLFIENVW